MPVAKKVVAEEKDKPVFDEQALAKLLEAAYVLQEHNRGLQEATPSLDLQTQPFGEQEQAGVVHDPAQDSETAKPTLQDDYTPTLAQIVEVQHEIQIRHLDLDAAMSLVAERVTEIAKAGGAGIGILKGMKVHYRAAAGLMTLPNGTEVPMDKALCVAPLKTGQVLRCADVNPEFLLDAQACHRRGIQSLIVVPVYHDGGIAGALELYYARTAAFTEQDVHTCQLMAGLITEALARDEDLARKELPPAERAAMLEALEKLKPTLAALIDKPAATAAKSSPGSVFICSKCGHQLLGQEQFCGKCGLPRSSDYEPPSMQSKVASLWHMQEAQKKSAVAPQVAPQHEDEVAQQDPLAIAGHTGPERPLADSIEEEMPELFADPEARIKNMPEAAEPPQDMMSDLNEELAPPEFIIPSIDAEQEQVEEEENMSAESSLAPPKQGTAWSSAASAREFLEQLAPDRRGAWARLLQARRGDIYLAVAVILVVCVLGWGIWSSHPVGATASSAPAAAGHRKPSPDADLSWFDRMLVQMGLAEAPAPPESKGNPDIQVWVDTQTALYYCPGADLYSKTPKGRFEKQRDAQLDQFEPASRKPCE